MRLRSRRLVWIGMVGLCGMALVAGPALAKGKEAKDPAKHLDRLDKKLDLTDEQRASVEQVLRDYHARAEALTKQWETLRQEKHDRINALLTSEQQAKFEKMGKKGHRKGWWGRKKHTKDD